MDGGGAVVQVDVLVEVGGVGLCFMLVYLSSRC